MDLSGIIDSIICEAKQTNNLEDGDYLSEDGLYYCGQCGTQKQCRVNILGTDRIVPCLCKCASAKLKAEEEEKKKQAMEQRIQRMRISGFPESGMVNWTFENDDMTNPKLTAAMKRYVEGFEKYHAEGRGLLLYGETGTGKTYAACEVANALIDRGIPCLVTNFSRIANTVFGTTTGKQDYYDSLNRFQLLVVDDLAAERKTEYMSEIVYTVIDNRIRTNLPMIVTTNLTKSELTHPSDMTYKRIYSRLMGSCFPVEVKGEDRRFKSLQAGYIDMAKELGL